ncbi:MAG TPA: response regulator transcription factor [Chitinophagaceae bacterium]|nr:response regulator transcription factor [Chitinophagaceae bacterium]
MSTVIKMIIADDHKIFIDGLKLLLRDEPDMNILAVAGNGKELMDMIPSYNPDIVLLDINMPVINGLETGRMIKQTHPHIKFMILSTYNDEHLIEKARQYGANAYVLKTANKEELLKNIRCVYKGGSCFPERYVETKSDFDSRDQFLKQFDLTKREVEILRFIRQDYSNQQIAEELFLSVYTVQTHRKNIMSKLNINTSTALMKFILENNI